MKNFLYILLVISQIFVCLAFNSGNQYYMMTALLISYGLLADLCFKIAFDFLKKGRVTIGFARKKLKKI